MLAKRYSNINNKFNRQCIHKKKKNNVNKMKNKSYKPRIKHAKGSK